MAKVRCVGLIIFFCLLAWSVSVHAQTPLPTVTSYSSFYDRLDTEKRSQWEASLYSHYFTPLRRIPTYKEKIDAYVIWNFALLAQKKYEENPAAFSVIMEDARWSLKHNRDVFYELYNIPTSPLDKIDGDIKKAKNDLLGNLLGQLISMSGKMTGAGIPVGNIVSMGRALKEIQDLEVKRNILQSVDMALPAQAEDIRNIYFLLKRISEKLPPGFSVEVDAYFPGDALPISIRADSDTLISHDPIIAHQVQLSMADGKIISLEKLLSGVKKNIETVEMAVQQEQNEEKLRITYLQIRRATMGVSNIIGFFDRSIESKFNRVASPLIDMSETYSVLTLKMASAEKFKLDLPTLTACATGIGAVFALADFLITGSRPSDMEILMEHLNGQFERLHERFDKLHEHLDLVHRDLMRATFELLSVMQQRFDTTDRKLEEIKRVLNLHTEKLKVIEGLIREQRSEARNTDMDKDREALIKSVRQYQNGTQSLDDCLFDCEMFAEETSRRRPHVMEVEDYESDIQNGFFHKFLKAPYFSNIRQLLKRAYPDLPEGSEPIIGVYEGEYAQALQSEEDSFRREPPVTLADIKNIETWVIGVNTHLQQASIADKEGRIRDSAQRSRILSQIDRFLVSGEKIERGLESIFYQLDSEFEKASVQRDFVTKLFRDYTEALNQVSDFMENKKSHYDAEERLSDLDVWNPQAIHTIPESTIVSDFVLSPIFPSELKAAVLLGIGRVSVSYESPRWGVVDGQEGRLLFNVIFKFQEEGQESKMIGTVTIASDQVASAYPSSSPQDALNNISANDLITLVMHQIKSRATPAIQRQYVIEEGVVGHKKIMSRHSGGRDHSESADSERVLRVEDIRGPVQADKGWPIYTWKGFDLSSSDIISKTEAKRQKHAQNIISGIIADIKNESAPFEKLEGQKALIKAYLSLGLTQSFTNHPYLKSFFSGLFSHELMDKEEMLYFLSQPQNNPHDLLKEGLLRSQKLSCLLLGKTEGCEDEALYSPEGLLAERMNANELPDILTKTLRHLSRAQKTFSN